MTRHDDPFPASTGRLDPSAIRAGYVGVRGENASKNMVVVETQAKVAGYAGLSIHLDLQLAAGDNFCERMPQHNATIKRYIR
jgi:hypothetical protein